MGMIQAHHSLSGQCEHVRAEVIQREVLWAQKRVLGKEPPHTLTVRAIWLLPSRANGKNVEAEADAAGRASWHTRARAAGSSPSPSTSASCSTRAPVGIRWRWTTGRSSRSRLSASLGTGCAERAVRQTRRAACAGGVRRCCTARASAGGRTGGEQISVHGRAACCISE